MLPPGLDDGKFSMLPEDLAKRSEALQHIVGTWIVHDIIPCEVQILADGRILFKVREWARVCVCVVWVGVPVCVVGGGRGGSLLGDGRGGGCGRECG